MLLATGTPRYTTAYSKRARVHVIWDNALGDFCTLPNLKGEPELLTFDHSVRVLRWLMRCQERGLNLEMPKGTPAKACPEVVF